jgi:hypothetical protein
VSLKYCTEKSLLKTHVAFFMKVTVHNIHREEKIEIDSITKII